MELSHKKIAAFLKGELPADEMAQVNEHLANDPLDADLVAHIADALEAGERIESLEAKAKQVERASFRVGGNATKRNTSVLKWAAVILVLILPGLYFLTKQPDSDSLYTAYFSPYQDVVTVRGTSEDSWNLIMGHYNKGEYEQAGNLMSNLDSTEKAQPFFQLYMGITQLSTNKVSDAQRTFSSMVSNKENLYLEHARWYLSLTYLRLGDTSQAKLVLKSLCDSSTFYEEKARQLLTAID